MVFEPAFARPICGIATPAHQRIFEGKTTMKRVLSSFAAGLICVASQSAANTDAEYLADCMVGQGLGTTVRDAAQTAYTLKLTELLLEKSVRVLDGDKLAGLIPEEIADEQVATVRQGVLSNLSGSFDEDELGKMAEFLRSGAPCFDDTQPVQDAPSRPVSLEDWTKDVRKTLTSDAFKIESVLTAAIVGQVIQQVSSTIQVEVDLSAPFVPDLLETNGLFAFPNRIYRKDLITQLRDTNG